jgi:uncharacterized protein (TIGR03118 family)
MYTWLFQLSRIGPRPQSVARSRWRRPSLEVLERRCLLSGAYLQTNLVSDLPGVARTTDANLRNPWGIVASATSPFWIADNATGVSTLYNGSGVAQSLVVTIPPPAGGTPPAAPTGIVFNSTTSFVVSSGGKSGAAAFLFATEDGTISGWNPTVDTTHAILEVDNSAPGAVYKGLALGSNASGNLLFAANFNAGTVDVFDTSFHTVNLPFHDPTLPAGFAPFGIRNIGGSLYVTYAMQDAAKHDDVAGPGNGFIDVFDTNGNLLRRLVSGDVLNSPWGLALAPSTFGAFSNDLLVGNFGDGLINAFNPATGAALGQVLDVHGNAIHIDGLWGLSFGNGGSAGSTSTLFFTAGINGERNGLFGSLQPSLVGTPNQIFVDQVYQALLNRQAEPAGLTFWANQLDQGVTRSQVVAGIEGSTEFLTAEVQNAYTQFLHRAADAGGLTSGVNALKQGATLEQVEAGLVGSTEYFQSRGGGTNSGFLTALYQDALNRALDTGGQALFTQQLTSGTTTAQVAAEVFASPEFRQDVVQGFYQRFLHRAADTAGLNSFVAALQQGQQEKDVEAAILASAEFFQQL